MVKETRPSLQTTLVLAISGLAWIVMILQHSSWAYVLPAGLRVSHDGSWFTPAWLLGWFVMVLAMMLPPALPFLGAVRKLVAGRDREKILYLQAASTFVGLWMLVGVVLALVSLLLNRTLTHWPWAVQNSTTLAAIAAFLAAAYQFSPLKRSCLIACRSPTGLMLVYWNPARPQGSLLTVASRYALVCIGCCWPLMAVTLLVGSVLLPVMVVVSLLMLAERLLPSVRPLVPIQAAAAFALGVLMLANPAQQSTMHHHHSDAPAPASSASQHVHHAHSHP
jgi:predicted metal-binding membrane protein